MLAAPRNVLVTGVGGICGHRIAARMVSAGYRVFGLSRAPSGTGVPAGVIPISMDLAELDRFPEKMEIVVHAAATSPAPGIDADAIVRDNVVALRRLLSTACAAGVRRIVFLSSLSAFGCVSAAEVDESTPSIDPDLYGLTKLLSERLIEACAGREISALALRLPGVIGPGSRRNWLSSVKAAIGEGRAVRIYNPDAAFNNAVHADGLAAFVAQLGRRDWKGFDMVTLGASGFLPVRDVVGRLMAAMRANAPIELIPSSKSSFTVSYRRAMQLYGYIPESTGDMIDRFGAEPR